MPNNWAKVAPSGRLDLGTLRAPRPLTQIVRATEQTWIVSTLRRENSG